MFSHEASWNLDSRSRQVQPASQPAAQGEQVSDEAGGRLPQLPATAASRASDWLLVVDVGKIYHMDGGVQFLVPAAVLRV